MKTELQNKLFDKYPKIFRDRTLPMNQTCMCWGLEIEDGWYDIIENLCYALTYTYSTGMTVGDNEFIDVQPPQVIANQVKEKMGTLRFYFHLEFDKKFSDLAYGETPNPQAKEIAERYSAYMDGIVHFAEILSGRTCEQTGKEGEMHTTGGSQFGWHKVLNREFAKTDEFCVSRNYLPVADQEWAKIMEKE